MEAFREFLSLITFICALFLLLPMFAYEFNWIYFALGLFLFALSDFVWPSKKRGQRYHESRLLDVLEVIIQSPMEFFFWLFRLIGRILRFLFGGKDNGVDIDF